MKLELSLDLEPIRARALAEIDQRIAIASARLSALGPIYAAKLRNAQDVVHNLAQPCAQIVQEADLRGVSPYALCELIIKNDAKHQDRLMQLELARQNAKKLIAAAPSQQAIEAAVNMVAV